MAVLIDCHSMPSASMGQPIGARPHFVLGDRFGTSCDTKLTRFMRDILQAGSYEVQINRPYAGGFITEYTATRRKEFNACSSRSIARSTSTRQPCPRARTLPTWPTLSAPWPLKCFRRCRLSWNDGLRPSRVHVARWGGARLVPSMLRRNRRSLGQLAALQYRQGGARRG